ncbi:MAG TPA: hypothetical protein VNO19_12675 [Gemmatimonadales bacterium]|nr:hypothetical protein [Gemmatimonadales bacterium]
MEKQTYPALNTREFVAKWHSIVEENLVTELAKLLRPLAAGSSGNTLGPEQCAALSRHIAYALQVAGSDSGGLQAAVEYLRQAATIDDEGPEIS